MFYPAEYSGMSGSFEAKIPTRDSGIQAVLTIMYTCAIIFYGFSWDGIPWIFASEVLLLLNRVRTWGIVSGNTLSIVIGVT